MRIILAGYLKHDGRNIPTDTLAHAARGAHNTGTDVGDQNGGGQSDACTTAAYVLASESYESFVELMRHLDISSSHPPRNGRARSAWGADPFREGSAPAQPLPTDWSLAARDRPSSRLTGGPARMGSELFSNSTNCDTAQPADISGLSLSHRRHSQADTDGRPDAVSAGLDPSTPPTPPSPPPPSGKAADPTANPAAAASSPRPSSRDEVLLGAPSNCYRKKRAELGAGRLTNDSRCWLELDVSRPGEDAEGGEENRLHERKRPAGAGSSETFSIDHNRFTGVIDSPQQGDRGAFDGQWLHAREWFIEADSSNWVSVAATSTAAAGDVAGAGGDQMDMSSTFGTDNVRRTRGGWGLAVVCARFAGRGASKVLLRGWLCCSLLFAADQTSTRVEENAVVSVRVQLWECSSGHGTYRTRLECLSAGLTGRQPSFALLAPLNVLSRPGISAPDSNSTQRLFDTTALPGRPRLASARAL